MTFYIGGALALLFTAIALTRSNAVHALLCLVASFLASAVVFYTLGAPFIAALEVIIYAGSIMVLFLFLVMLLPATDQTIREEKIWAAPKAWVVPGVIGTLMAVELIAAIAFGPVAIRSFSAKEIGAALFTRSAVAIELSSFLLLSGLIGAFHLGARR
jgi:NADH-quinone oxidoreductase subunit J